ncbi:leucine--tRNA ligase [Candidatus Parcubacteria bacterium]|nr:MAG: leucine--tRNA ligase [Candidatus Parcubacteria bacterium]
MTYDHKSIDAKWQKRWEQENLFTAEDFSEKEKFYCLIEFPYPSGSGLHIGHPRSYTALDVLARKKRMQGFNVLYPIGWDAFGLPTENYAIKHGRKPQDVTRENIATFKRQLKSLGISFDWSREINTTDPKYYKWTQWQFLQFFKAGLAYKAKMAINWCTDCKIGLANEEVVNGRCERCGGEVIKKDKEQWMIAITKYADKLLDDLDTVNYLPKIKKQQKDWIGRSEGAEVDFSVDGLNEKITVFTTRPDTLFGVTYLVLAPEHNLVNKIVDESHRSDVQKYIENTLKKSEIERNDLSKEKTGVFTGAYAINPVNGDRVPIWIADYVMTGYGTGAIMAVPAHDERDYEFAQKFNLPIKQVIKSSGNSQCYSGEGEAINSDFINGLIGAEAKNKIIEWLENNNVGRRAVNYKLRDWVFSRQRYWGEPIPLIYCDKCGWVPVPEEDLPVVLPEVEKYQPTDTGESPLAAIEDWVNTNCPKCSGPAKRETDTMPNWAGSSWYFLRYTDPHNDETFADMEKLKYWMPVDLYNGGMEHTTLHLLYSRFWNKFLFDQGLVPTSEPYARRHSHGLILAADGTKMSKSKNNGVSPDEVVEKYGADSLRVYEMFMGPFEEPVPWSNNGIVGVKRFLDKVIKLADKVGDSEPEKITKVLHKTIKKVSEDIDNLRFNTAVAQMMTFVNEVNLAGSVRRDSLLKFLQILCPFAPHVANEVAEKIGIDTVLEATSWPDFNEELLIESEVSLAVQVNGKLRAVISVPADTDKDKIIEQALAHENVAKYLNGEPKKVIYVSGKLVNFVV